MLRIISPGPWKVDKQKGSAKIIDGLSAPIVEHFLNFSVDCS